MRFMAVFFGALLAWLALEAFSFLLFIVPQEGFTSPKTLLARGKLETTNGTACSGNDTLRAHPYLSYVKDTRCASAVPVHSGFSNLRPIPPSNDPATYDILVLGGSVAEILSNWRVRDRPDPAAELERRLNDRFTGPRGEPLRVYNAAVSAGSWPQQLIATSIFQRLMDATLVLDGHNEAAWNVLHPLGTPLFQLYNQLHPAPDGGSLVRWNRVAALMLRTLQDTPFGHSPILYRLHQAAHSLAYGPDRAVGPNAGPADFGVQYTWPAGQPIPKGMEANSRAYGLAIRQLHRFTLAAGLASAHFMQPVPALHKPLTPAERAHGKLLDPGLYEAMSREFARALKDGGIQGADLTRLFAGTKSAVYSDYVHFTIDPTSGASPGYDSLVEAMLPHLAKAYGLKPRRP